MTSLLSVTDLRKQYPIKVRRGWMASETRFVRAVDGVSLELSPGETLGLVGESGCGKSTLGRCILRLIEPSGGTVTFQGRDLLALSPEEMRRARRDVQIVFQDPLASLNPRMTVGAILSEPMLAHSIVGRRQVAAEVAKLLDQVGLPSEAADRYPHEFSGGQRQRIGIARAISVKPRLIIADEPISALDVSIRAQIINLFREIQKDTEVALLFIAHDLGAVRQISHNVAVMYLGVIVETGPSEIVFENPRHPYTRALLAAIPTVTGPQGQSDELEREPGQADPPVDGECRYRPRCPHAKPLCSEREPDLLPLDGHGGHRSACLFAADLPLFSL